MIRRQKHLYVGISLLLFVSLLYACASVPGETDGPMESSLRTLMKMEPIPELAPQEVVEIQLAALKANDQKDRGIELAYRFTSTRNKKLLADDIERFTEIIRRDSYAPMFEHIRYEMGPVDREDQMAAVAVMMNLTDGKTIGYIFILSRQNGGEYDDCWMTEGVVQVVEHESEVFEIPETQDV